MSITQAMTDNIHADFDTCPQCGTALPHGALFCASCGERLDREKGLTGLLQDEQEISTRYRILSLLRRRPSVNLYLALDLQPSAHGRMVAMRDIDLSSCGEQARASVIEQAQREYDLLRHLQPPYVMHAIDLRYAQGHLYTVAGFAPLTTGPQSAGPGEDDGQEEVEARQKWPRLTTLQDFLQSGQGLPSEKRALHMMSCLCVAADRLHSQHIMLGDLDPSTVILNGATVDDQVGLMIFWLPPGTREALSPENPASLLSYFIAPEALQGEADVRSDIYSLGAIFYLLLTGMPPEESSLRQRSRLRAPYEINPRMSLHISESVMQALAVDPNERFQTIAAFTQALHDPRYRRPVSQPDVPDELSPEVETVRILPLSYKDLARWRSGQPKKQTAAPVPVPATASVAQSQAAAPEEPLHTPEPPAAADEDVATLRLNRGHPPSLAAAPVTGNDIPAAPGHVSNGHTIPENIPATPATELEEGWAGQVPQTPGLPGASVPSAPSRSMKQRLAAIWSAINPRNLVRTRSIAPAPRSVEPGAASAPPATPGAKKSLDIHGWIEQIKHAVLGQQQHVVAAAAII